MNWMRLAEAFIVPLLPAAAVAALLWHKRRLMAGTILASAVFFLNWIVFAGLEFLDAFRYRLSCQGSDLPCPPSDPGDFTKIMAYGAVAMVQVMLLYLVGQSVESRVRENDFAPEWRH